MSSSSEEEPFQSSGSEFLPSNSCASENNLDEEQEPAPADNEPAVNKRGRKKTRKQETGKRNVQKIKRISG